MSICLSHLRSAESAERTSIKSKNTFGTTYSIHLQLNIYRPFRRGEVKLGAAAAGLVGAKGLIAKRAAGELNLIEHTTGQVSIKINRKVGGSWRVELN